MRWNFGQRMDEMNERAQETAQEPWWLGNFIPSTPQLSLTYFLEGVCFERLGWWVLCVCGGGFCAGGGGLSVNLYWNLALSINEATSRWLHRNSIPNIGCHYFRPEVLALPRNTQINYFCLICFLCLDLVPFYIYTLVPRLIGRQGAQQLPNSFFGQLCSAVKIMKLLCSKASFTFLAW
jgi:hypothetical protein